MQLSIPDTPSISPDKDFDEERECYYKGEQYSVRDNGAIMRHARVGKPTRKDDNMWTFGIKNESNGYMYLCSHRVHIIVATAFHGEHNSKVYVVDHIDTNRCNNRSENLRWLTRLENALNNPITRKKIIYLCGSIENFINDPSILRNATNSNQDIMWMRTVTAEEAKAAYIRVMEWAEKTNEETPSHGGSIGEWIYQPKTMSELEYKDNRSINPDEDTYYNRQMLYDPWGNVIGPKPTRKEKKQLKENNTDTYYYPTSNKLAQQLGWKPYTKPEFPCCPTEVDDNPIQEYASKLIEGKDFVVAMYGNSTVYKYIIDGNQLLVTTKIPNGVKDFGLTRITWNGQAFIHESIGTFFEENGVKAAITRIQGLEWNGPKSIDDYC